MDFSRSAGVLPVDTKPDVEQLGVSVYGGHHSVLPASSPVLTHTYSGLIGTGSSQDSYNSFPVAASSVRTSGTAAAIPVGNYSLNGSPVTCLMSPYDKKQICAICGDRASGKHYGVHSCEGCKGFFKRTVRKDLQYACREEKNCTVDRRQRNRCQYCRYQQCLAVGMKREAVQEERLAVNGMKADGEAESTTTSANSVMPIDQLRDAELASEPQFISYVDATDDPIGTFCHAAEKQLFALVDWAKNIPHFTELPLEDQVTLLRCGWNELLIAGFSHRSMAVQDSILLSTGLRVKRNMANDAGIGAIFDRVLLELVAKMREMEVDKAELGCLRAIVLYNPDAKGLVSIQMVESLRERVYATMEEYCRLQHPDQPGRFAKLLLRLPALRSIGLKCYEHLFFYKLVSDTHVDTFLLEMLDIPNSSDN